MKSTALFAFAVILPALIHAAPLAAPASVQATPAVSAPVIAVLPAGTDMHLAKDAQTPAGWTAITLAGPHTVFVNDQDVLKNFDVKPGASYYTAPESSAPVLTIATADDEVQITGLSGRWLQLNLKRSVIGYVHTDSKSVAAPIAATPASSTAPAASSVSRSPAAATTPALVPPVTARPPSAASAGRVVESRGSALLPRVFQGTLVSSRSAFRPRRPFDYQINDSRGVRYAYLDLSKLLMTQRIDTMLGRTIEVFGTAANLEGTKDIVIKVETLKLP